MALTINFRFMHMTSFWAKLLDLTYHYSAIFTGSTFNAGIKGVFGERDIEDLWIPYLCVTTDITDHQMRVHRCCFVRTSSACITAELARCGCTCARQCHLPATCRRCAIHATDTFFSTVVT